MWQNYSLCQRTHCGRSHRRAGIGHQGGRFRIPQNATRMFFLEPDRGSEFKNNCFSVQRVEKRRVGAGFGSWYLALWIALPPGIKGCCRAGFSPEYGADHAILVPARNQLAVPANNDGQHVVILVRFSWALDLEQRIRCVNPGTKLEPKLVSIHVLRIVIVAAREAACAPEAWA